MANQQPSPGFEAYAPVVAACLTGSCYFFRGQGPVEWSLNSEAPLEERIAENKRRALELAAAFAAGVFAVFSLIFLALGASWIGLVVSAVIAVVWVLLAWRNGASVVLELCDVEPADHARHPRLFNVVDGLRAAMGLPRLGLYVVDDPAMNALAVGRDERHASLVVTQGLLDSTSLVELESVVAREMYRIKVGDTALETFTVPTIGAPAVLSEVFDRWEPLRRFFAFPMPLVEKALARIHPGRAELDTDVGAMRFTRYPPALAAALEKMEGRSALAMAAPVTAHLWSAPPLSPTTHPSLSAVHAPLQERVAVLEEL